MKIAAVKILIHPSQPDVSTTQAAWYCYVFKQSNQYGWVTRGVYSFFILYHVKVCLKLKTLRGLTINGNNGGLERKWDQVVNTVKDLLPGPLRGQLLTFDHN